MDKIIVALTQDNTARSIFDQAMRLAQATQGCLNLINVLAPPADPGLTFSPYSNRQWKIYTENYRAEEAERFEFLQGLSNEAKAAGVAAELTQRIGGAGPEICDLAKTWGATLILIGSHGRRGLAEMLLGSVSNYVVHHAFCSVMVVHSRAHAP